MEHAAHHRRHALDRRGARHAARRARRARASPARIFERARRGERQRRHDHPERAASRGRAGAEHVVHRPARRPARSRASALEPIVGELGIGEVDTDAGDGQGLDRRRRDEVAPRRRREGVQRCSASEGINIEMISTSPIKISCVIRGDRVADAVRALHARVRARRGRDRRPSGRSASARGAAMSAGALPRRRRRRHRRGRHDDARACCASAASRRARSCRSPPSARPGASSTAATASCSALTDEAIQGFDVALFSAGGATSRRVGAALRRRGRGRRRQLLALAHGRRRAARRRRGQPRGARRATAGSSPTRTARRCRWSSRSSRCTTRPGIERLVISHLPVGVGHRAARRVDELLDQAHALLHERRTAGARGLLRTRSPSTCCRTSGRFADGDDYTDEERKLIDETRKILGDPTIAHQRDLRARAGRQRPLGVGQRRDARRRSRPSAARELLAAAPGVDGARRPGRRRLPAGDRRRRPRRRVRRAASAATRATSAR